jgi:dTMP kinase
MSQGLFVNFEGVDGSGKTTALKAVAARLREALGRDVLECKLPGDASAGSDIGALVRQLLWTDPTTKRMAPGVADLLFLADHVQCTETVIKPALEAGRIVLCDRYTDSQLAYSAHPSKRTPRWAAELYGRVATLEPDLTILLVGDPAALWARSKAREGAEGAKQDGKAWGGAEAAAFIQDYYVERLSGLARTRIVSVSGVDADFVAAEAYNFITEALS